MGRNENASYKTLYNGRVTYPVGSLSGRKMEASGSLVQTTI